MPSSKEQTLRELCDKFELFDNKVAIVSFGAEDKQQLAFKELLHLIRRLATGLLKADLEQKESVMILANSSTEFIIAALSIIYAGGVCVPVDLQSSDEVLNHIIEDSEAKRIFVDAKGLERLQHLHRTKHMQIMRLDNEGKPDNWRALLPAKSKDKYEELCAEDPAVLFYTSGTTGLPKGVPLTHANITVQLDAVVKTKLVTQSDRILLPLPLFHVYPFVMGLWVAFSLGITVILPKSVTGPEIIRAIKEGEATVLIAVPRLLRALYTAIETKARSNNMDSTAFSIAYKVSDFFNTFLALNIGKLVFASLHKRFPTLRLLACGGALLEPELAHKLLALGWQIAVGYGLTETSPLLTIRMPGARDLKSVGKPISCVQVRIQKVKDSPPGDLDKKGRQNSENGKPDSKEGKHNKIEEDIDEQPEIQVRGKSIFAGYRNLPEKTAATFTEDGWFKTGDTGYMMLGNLYVTGRISITIKSEGGKKIQPEEVEKAYAHDPAIREVGVLQNKQKLVALVVPNITTIGHNDPHDKIAEAMKSISATLPSYYRVTDFALSRELLPRTNLGKIRRHELGEAYEKSKAAESSKTGKGTSKEEMSSEDKAILGEPVAKACWDWLHERFPDADITFNSSPQLDLNVDSLEWLNLTLEIQERFGIELNEEAIARVDVVRDLLKEIIDASKSGTHSVSPFDEPESFLDDSQKEWLKPLNPFMLSLARGLYWANLVVMRICFRVSAEGLEHIPKGQVVFTPNHASYLDAFALAAVLDFKRMHKTQWAGWAGIALNNPFNAFIYRLGQAIPIEPKRSLISSLALAAAVLKNHKNLVWFPEGERTLTGKLLPFKSGIGTLLQHFPVKVVPVRLVGTREALPPGAFFPSMKKITVVFGDPILPDALLKEGTGESDAECIANGLHDKVKDLHASRAK